MWNIPTGRLLMRRVVSGLVSLSLVLSGWPPGWLVPFQLDESRSKRSFERDEPHRAGERIRSAPAEPHTKSWAGIVGTALGARNPLARLG